MADVVVIAKTDVAEAADVERVRENVVRVRPGVPVLRAASPLTIDDPGAVRGRRVIVVEDGPTITHGGMAYGAGTIAARRAGAAEIVDPRPFASGSIADVYREYPHIGAVLPAVGYREEQVRDLAQTIARSDADVVVMATPSDITRLVAIAKPVVRVRYELADVDAPGLGDLVREFLRSKRCAS
jgi:predicted GTPase